ncbi:hypothetical protein PGTUg99_008257 [Puccinia graminis f. sp. tritici]|uniref:Uncharacterized protein n=1 Tax=Puccinia graminis f. sp. tritici TaxID=56615 RepID=A0A5B0S345_PUCGR|nr:hypothetical protein PGTUg99_008257 [Puccinia graminis f. sp. tritici]
MLLFLGLQEVYLARTLLSLNIRSTPAGPLWKDKGVKGALMLTGAMFQPCIPITLAVHQLQTPPSDVSRRLSALHPVLRRHRQPRALSLTSSNSCTLEQSGSQLGTPYRERIGSCEDSATSDFATPITNQARLETSSLFTGVINYVGTLKASDQVPAAPCHPGLRVRHRSIPSASSINEVVVLSSGGVL